MQIPHPSQNRLLALLSHADRTVIEANLHPVMLPLRAELERPDTLIESCFFLTDGIASVVAHGKSGKRIEVGLIGREGVSGTAVILGSDRSPNATYMQVAGAGYRMSKSHFREAMDKSPSFSATLTKFVHAFMIQNAQTALVNGKAKLEERIARWILMAHDRVETENFAITHEFLALMLGVRRAGVTVALHILEGKGLIRSKRGQVLVIDRDGLEKAAGGAYGIAEAEYERLFSVSK